MAGALNNLTLSLMRACAGRMLIYLGGGPRTYGLNPIPLRCRNLWDFQAIISGVAAPTFPGLLNPSPLVGDRLWVFAPDCVHGWVGDGANECEVGVFQFPYVPEILHHIMPASGWLSVGLTSASTREIRRHISVGTEQLRSPSPVSQLHFQSILNGLSILIMEALEMNQMSPVASQARHVVGEAISWYGANLHLAPTLDDVARHVSVSPAHLRRMFHQSTAMSPKEALDQLRFQKARELLEDPRNTLEVIAELTGFFSASAFSRAFKHRHGLSPQRWRQQLS